MFELRPNEDFEPSINVKALWTYTRKSPFNAAGVRLPGLFITKSFDIDSFAFACVVALELWGLYSIVSSIGLADAEGAFNVLGLAIVLALFFIDVALAILRHLPAGPNCKYKNKEVLATTAHERHTLKKERGLRRWLTPICTVLILVVAAVKIYGFYMLSDGEVDGLTISVLVSYVFAALLHINNTGYFLCGLFFSLRLRHEYGKWAGGSDNAHEVTIYDWRPFSISIPKDERIKIKEATAGKHRIIKETDNGDELYILKTWGVLTDGQLNALIVQQPSENAQTTVARVGLCAQLHILEAAPLPQITDAAEPTDESKLETGASSVKHFPVVPPKKSEGSKSHVASNETPAS